MLYFSAPLPLPLSIDNFLTGFLADMLFAFVPLPDAVFDFFLFVILFGVK